MFILKMIVANFPCICFTMMLATIKIKGTFLLEFEIRGYVGYIYIYVVFFGHGWFKFKKEIKGINFNEIKKLVDFEVKV